MTTVNPNHPSNLPTAGDGDGPLALLSYGAILQDMKLDQAITAGVAEALIQQAQDVPWVEVWKAFPTVSTDALSANHFRGYLADAPTSKYSLVVRMGRVEVLYGWRVCRPLAAAGSRQAGLLGERRFRGSTEIPPKLVVIDGGIGLQDGAFEKVAVRPQPHPAIETAFAAEAPPALVEAADAAAEAAPAALSVRKVLTVHPKLAALFMRGLPIPEAVDLAAKLYHAVPADQRAGLDPLLTFCRAAATATEADPPVSALEGGWTTLPTTEPEPLEEWYLDLLSVCAPRPTSDPAPSPGSGGADTVTVDALNRLGDTMAGAMTLTDRSKPREYSATERETLAYFSNYKGPLEGVTDDILPPFWKAFKSERGKHSNCRLFLEARIRNGFKEDEVQYDFLVTTALITDLKNLDFVGGDSNVTYGMRTKGLSIYAMAPATAANDTAASRAEFMAMEASNDRLTPTDRMKISRLVASICADTPSDRTTLACWVNFSVVFIRTLFTEECPALESLKDIVKALRSPMHWTGYQEEDFRVLAWLIHGGVRRFFLRSGTLALDRLSTDIASNVRPNRSAAPDELMTMIRTPAPPRDRKRPGRPQVIPEGPGKVLKTAYAFTKALADETSKGFDALKTANKKVTLKAYASGRDEIRALLGTDFLDLCDGDPCLTFFVRGRCTYPDCRLCHSLRNEPSDAVLAGMLQRVQAKTAKIIASPPSF